jgi:hypothetical protein
MDIGELVAVFVPPQTTEEYCKDEESKSQGWKSRINQWGSEQNCSANRLYTGMEGAVGKKEGFLGPPAAFVSKPAAVGYAWSLSLCQPDRFPLQAHHIIPKNHLPTHGVCAFLAKRYKKHLKIQLTEDTYYDTDHANNGYCMPYATPLKEWKQAKKDDEKLAITFLVMDKTGRQLHQGSHRAGPYQDSPVAEEEEGIHAQGVGYLSTVNLFLNAVHDGAETHVTGCATCKPDSAKRDIQPLEAVVRHLDQVAGLVKLLADANRIFVSKPAYLHLGPKRRDIEIPKWLDSRGGPG